MKKLGPKFSTYNPNDEWINNLRSNSDSTDTKPVYYSKEYLKRFNADNGGEFFKKCDKPYLNQFILFRSIILDKKHRGTIEVSYFSKLNSKPNVRKAIKRTSQRMISYYE